jgi:hypothetical protein
MGSIVIEKILPCAVRILGAAAFLTAFEASATAESIGDFYRGKQIELIVATETGSIYDTWGRLMARHLGKHIPGNPTFVTKDISARRATRSTQRRKTAPPSSPSATTCRRAS